jgi:hypothetical protein
MKVTNLNRYALPVINELQVRIQGEILSIKIALNSGYSLVRIHKGDKWDITLGT